MTAHSSARSVAAVVGTIVVAALALIGCSSTSPTSLRAESSLTSKGTVLTKVGAEDSKTYGWNDLVGTATTDLGTFDVDMLGNVDYDNGNGPFFGFLTLTASNGDHIAMRMDGGAKVLDDGSTALSSRLTVIDGSGAYVGVSGHGSFTGTRIAQVGAPIEITITVGLDR